MRLINIVYVHFYIPEYLNIKKNQLSLNRYGTNIFLIYVSRSFILLYMNQSMNSLVHLHCMLLRFFTSGVKATCHLVEYLAMILWHWAPNLCSRNAGWKNGTLIIVVERQHFINLVYLKPALLRVPVWPKSIHCVFLGLSFIFSKIRIFI